MWREIEVWWEVQKLQLGQNCFLVSHPTAKRCSSSERKTSAWQDAHQSALWVFKRWQCPAAGQPSRSRTLGLPQKPIPPKKRDVLSMNIFESTIQLQGASWVWAYLKSIHKGESIRNMSENLRNLKAMFCLLTRFMFKSDINLNPLLLYLS